jgi:hypothetical protein
MRDARLIVAVVLGEQGHETRDYRNSDSSQLDWGLCGAGG